MNFPLKLLIGLNLGFLFVSLQVLGFPDTLRHGYVNCTSCHVSPSGGGLLNGYGRSLSRELLSTWSYSGEEQPLHGFLSAPESWAEKFFVGGDVRYISKKVQGPRSEIDEGFLMQAQIRMGVVLQNFKLFLTLGKIENPRKSQEVKPVSPEYYLLWSPKEDFHWRVGRFEPVYGLRLSEHNLWTRSEVGLAPWLERDAVEVLYEGESQFASLSGFQSTSAVSSASQTTGYSVTMDQIFFETCRIGVSGINSEGQGVRLRSLGLHGTLSFSEKFYSHFEHSRVWVNDSSKEVTFFRWGYELVKGFTPIVQSQMKNDLMGASSAQNKSGVGFIWLPRPHFELMGTFEQIRNSNEDSKEGTILLHYYL